MIYELFGSSTDGGRGLDFTIDREEDQPQRRARGNTHTHSHGRAGADPRP